MKKLNMIQTSDPQDPAVNSGAGTAHQGHDTVAQMLAFCLCAMIDYSPGDQKSNIKVLAGRAPSEGSWGKILPCFSVAGGSRPFVICGGITPLSASVSTWPSPLCVWVSNLPLCLSLTRTPVTGLRPHSKSKNHLLSKSLITPAKTPLPNKVSVTGPGG